uniref:Ribosomal protein S16 n=1 Tax=Pteridomonas sp. YPF1301 TaxID=2766739 RepID=A0A7G1MRW2_9STRA|nr:ribosomal protein S16 [Pteridomonas sp. YPF1301]
MLKIRLKRYGQKHNPIYNVGIMLSQTKRNGLTIKTVGFYNPQTKEFKLNVNIIVQFLYTGVQPTSKLIYLLKKSNILY